MNNVVKFPNKYTTERRHYRIPLYSQADVDLVLFCLNAFGNTDERLNSHDLGVLDPIYVMKCLDIAYQSDILSNSAKSHVKAIRDSVEEVDI